jgi:hypothetical protein
MRLHPRTEAKTKGKHKATALFFVPLQDSLGTGRFGREHSVNLQIQFI